MIGVIAPTSGPLATVGVRQLDAIKWWQQDVNSKGGIKAAMSNSSPAMTRATPRPR